METTRQSLGERILAIRKRLNKTQTEFGELLGGIKKSPISSYENGDAYPRPDTLAQIARLGGVTLDWLIAGEETPAAPHHASVEQKGEVAASIAPGQQAARDRLIKQRAAALTGKAPTAPNSDPLQQDAGSYRPEKIDIHEGLLMTTRVLQSETGYAVALWSNLKSFDEAVTKEEKVKDLERKMDLMLEKMIKMEERLAEKSEISEKRDPAANA